MTPLNANQNRMDVNFAYFRNRQEFIEQNNEATRLLRGAGQRSAIKVGSLNLYRNVNTYEDPAKLQRYVTRFEDVMAKIDMGGAFNKQRLKITADERGIFSFGCASRGLYQPVEFYSVELANQFPNEFPDFPSGIVPAKYVDKIELLGTPKFFYSKIDPQNNKNKLSFECIRQFEGVEAMKLKEQGFAEYQDAQLVFRTTEKKAYVMFPKKSGKAKRVDLYIPKNQGISLENMLPSLMLAQFLKQYGVATRINVLRTFYGYGGYTGVGFMVKDFGEELDFNDLALQGADDRTWQLIRDCVNNLKEANRYSLKKFGTVGMGSYDTATAGGTPTGKQEWNDYFGRWRNFYMKEIDAGRLDPLSIDKRLMLYGVSENANESAVIERFYELLDCVDMQFNKVEDVCKRVYKRQVEEGTMTKNGFKDYMIEVFQEAYAYPVGGAFPETPDDAEKSDTEYNDKIEKLTDFLQQI